MFFKLQSFYFIQYSVYSVLYLLFSHLKLFALFAIYIFCPFSLFPLFYFIPQLYMSELENEFSQFMDWLHIFPVYKGKSSLEDEEEDESTRYMGKYKVRCAFWQALMRWINSVTACMKQVKD